MLILGRDELDVAAPGSGITEPVEAFVSEVDVMQHIFTEPTDTMTGGPLRRLQELAAGFAEDRGMFASDEGGSSVFVKLLFGRP